MRRPDLAVSRASNPLWHVVLQATEEILGRGVVDALVNSGERIVPTGGQPSSASEVRTAFDAWYRFQEVVEQRYGTRAGRGVIVRIGRACFKYGLDEFGGRLGLNDLAFRLKPSSERTALALQALADFLRPALCQRIRLESDEGALYLVLERCPLCSAQEQAGRGIPGCYLLIGLLQEMLYWVSGGRSFLVEEVECLASGSRRCTIKINKAPLS